MISICIPVYNFDVNALAEALLFQIKSNDLAAEIILIDDASTEVFQKKNHTLKKATHYIQLKENIGRARIRNLFTNYAKYNYLLFIDCDSLLMSNDYLKNYIEVILAKSPGIVCGGRVYETEKPEREKLLRWKYGHRRESLSASKRMENPNDSFMTNNFLIRKDLLLKYKFEESLSEYGHEDTLLGFLLKKDKIDILHIENPVLNGDIEKNEEYLHKTEKGIKNLTKILNLLNQDTEFIRSVNLLRWHYKLIRWRMSFLMSILYFMFKKSLRSCLSRGYGNTFLFNVYKLFYLNALLVSNRK